MVRVPDLESMMPREIRIYVEGGGDGRDGKARIREGFSQFLRDLNALARNKGISWKIIACGSRDSTFEDFKTALTEHRNAFNVLLVDSEGQVNQQHTPWTHLFHRDKWRKPSGCDDKYCHLMVQCMESWLIVDRDALSKYYGQGFTPNPLPGNPNVEEVNRKQLALALQRATERSRKGKYHKINHGPELLRLVDVAKVRAAAPHCDRLFTILGQKMGEHV